MFATWAQKNGYDPEKVSPVHKLAGLDRMTYETKIELVIRYLS